MMTVYTNEAEIIHPFRVFRILPQGRSKRHHGRKKVSYRAETLPPNQERNLMPGRLRPPCMKIVDDEGMCVSSLLALQMRMVGR
jgi:hypothetical protein